MLSDARVLDTRGLNDEEALNKIEKSISQFRSEDDEIMVITDSSSKKETIQYFSEFVMGCKTLIEEAFEMNIVIVTGKPAACF